MKTFFVGLMMMALVSVFTLTVALAEGTADKPATTAVGAPATTPTTTPAVAPEAPKVVTVDGTIKDAPSAQKHRTMASCTLVTDKESFTLILAPAKVLKMKELELTDGAKASVTGLQVTPAGGNPFITVNEVTINGKTVTLRSPKGHPTWTEFDVYNVVSFDGAVKDLVQPTLDELKAEQAALNAPKPAEPAKVDAPKTADPAKAADDVTKTKPAETPKPKRLSKDVSFTLVVDKATYTVRVGPVSYANEIGLILTNDAKVTVSGWQMNEKTPIMAREIVFGGKTYTLREANGDSCWQKKPVKTEHPPKSGAPAK